MPAVGSVNVRISATTVGLTKGLSSASSSLMSFGSSVTRMTSSIGVAAVGLLGLKSAFGAVTSAVQGVASMEQAEIAFGVLFKSADTAKTVLADLSKFAAETSYESPELIGAARSLAAFGTEASNIVPTMKMIGDVSSGVSAPIGEIAELYGKAKVQGRLFGEDINQLTGRGIPIIGELAKQFGVSESEVKKLVEEGKVGFPQLEKAFQSMTGAGGQFEGLMAKQSKSYAGMWSTLSDNVGSTFRDIASSLMEAFDVKTIMSSLIAFTGTVKDSFASVVPIIRSVASVIGTAWDLYVSYAGSVFTAFGATTSTTFEDIKTTAIGALEWIKSGLESLKPTAIALGTLVGQTWATIAAGAQTAFNLIATAGMALYTNFANVFSTLTEGSGVTFSNIADGAFTAVSNVIGFFYNLGDNLKSIWIWLGANWNGLLTDMVNLTLTFATNSLKNFATLFKGMYRIAIVWQGWTIGLFKRLFSFEVQNAVLTGLITIGKAIRSWAAAAWDTISSIFRRKAPSGMLTDFVNQAQKDLQMGMDNLDIGSSFGTVLQETAAELVGPLDGFQSSLTNLPEIKVDIPGAAKAMKSLPEIPAMQTVTGTGSADGTSATGAMTTVGAVAKTPVEGVAALNRGSTGALSAIFKAQRNDQGTAKAQLKAATQANKYLATIAERPQVEIVAGEVPA